MSEVSSPSSSSLLASAPRDQLSLFVDREQKFSVAVAFTTELCRKGQESHKLDRISAVALGRLLTATGLIGSHPNPRFLSVQLTGDGFAGQLFSDVTEEGHVRGYLRTDKSRAFTEPKRWDDRVSLSMALGRGSVSLIRRTEGGEFGQSSVPLLHGEVDLDVQYFLETSDQVPSVLRSDVLLGDDGKVAFAAGILIQGLPGASAEQMKDLSQKTHMEFLSLLSDGGLDALSKAIFPNAVKQEARSPLLWSCRCSREKVRSALKMLGPADLADMVDKKEEASVDCDFCGTTYTISPGEVEEVFLDTMVARGQ